MERCRHPVRNRAIVALAESGLTVSELVELRVAEASLEGREFRFQTSGRVLSVVLGREAAAAVADLLELRDGDEGPLLVSERRGKLSAQGIRHILLAQPAAREESWSTR